MTIELLKMTNVNGVPSYTVEQTLYGIGSLKRGARKSIGGGGTDAPQYTFASAAQIDDNRMVRIEGKRLRIVSSTTGVSGYSNYKADLDG